MGLKKILKKKKKKKKTERVNVNWDNELNTKWRFKYKYSMLSAGFREKTERYYFVAIAAFAIMGGVKRKSLAKEFDVHAAITTMFCFVGRFHIILKVFCGRSKD